MFDGVGQLLLVARDTVDVDERSGEEGNVLAEIQVDRGGLSSHDHSLVRVLLPALDRLDP
jgi:hypothetical protein